MANLPAHERARDVHDADGEAAFTDAIATKAARKLAARTRIAQPFAGLGMMGAIGWSVALPTLLGACLGVWLDHHRHPRHSWTLPLLMAGLVLGCLNAWHWVHREQVDPNDDPKAPHD